MSNPTVLTALIVDDQKEIREYLGEILETENFEVLYAADGNQAIQILKERPNLTLLVCDILMPDIDGLEVLSASQRLMRGKGVPRPKTILMSGGGAYESGNFYLQSTRLLGADITLSKPFGAKEFLGAIRALGFNSEGPPTTEKKRTSSPNESSLQ